VALSLAWRRCARCSSRRGASLNGGSTRSRSHATN